MNAVMLREAVENYKKIQLYAVDDCAIEQSIIQELKMNILENNRKCLDSFIRTQLLAKVISYLEFGFAYEAYAAVFDQVLALCATSKKELSAYVNKEAQYVKLSRENLQKIVVWKTEQKQKYGLTIHEENLERRKRKKPTDWVSSGINNSLRHLGGTSEQGKLEENKQKGCKKKK